MDYHLHLPHRLLPLANLNASLEIIIIIWPGWVFGAFRA
jgi:hypothetical protein